MADSALAHLRAPVSNAKDRRPLQRLLDTVALVLLVGTFAQLGNPDIGFHAVWVVLALTAFFFGLRATLLRIAICAVLVVVYASLATPWQFEELELIEWPLMFVISLVVAVMADRRSALAAHYTELYRRTNDRLLTAQEDERHRLAQDLHDGVGQVLTALSLTLDSAADRLPRGEPAAQAVARSRELAAIALEETRDVAVRLRPARLQETGLPAAVRELAWRAGIPVEVTFELEPGVIAAQVGESAIEVYRVIQEALANAARHARAHHVTIVFRELPNGLRVEVEDNGVGFDAAVAADMGLGLAGMRDRARVVGGTLTINSRPGHGTRIVLDLPIRVAAGDESDRVSGLPDGDLAPSRPA